MLKVSEGRIKTLNFLNSRVTTISLFIGIIFALLNACSENKPKKKKIAPEDFKIAESYFTDRSIFKPISQEYINVQAEQIATFFQRNINSLGFNGGFLVARNGQIIFEKYQGLSNYKTGQKIKPTTGMHLASVGKVLTATGIFRLIETKKLKLDQKINTILPSFPYEGITVRMLLNHRSGVPKYEYFIYEEGVWPVGKVLRNKDILRLLGEKNLPLDFEPNSKFTYCNSNFALLALIIEEITGKKFGDAMKSLVFEPIGMKNSFIFDYDSDLYNVSQSYKSTFERVKFDHLDAIYGDKNIYSTPRDLLRFDLAMYNDTFISKKLKKDIFKGYSYEKEGVKNYGLGIRLKEWEDGQKIFYHNGWWHGSNTTYISLKNEKVTIIVLSNKFSRKVYESIRLSCLFGNYPFSLVEEIDSTGLVMKVE